jgi:non-specific serine/threonine protein kinase
MGVTANRASSRRGLPAQPNGLIDREDTLARASRTLLRPDCRLLTLLGTGGIGKTRVAMALAERLETTFEHGILFVDLTAIGDASAVPSLLAAQFRVKVEDQGLLERIRDYLSSRHVLLVLDNFEHVMPAAMLVADLLEACPRLKVLVTSREPLRLRWEHRMQVSPLALPDPSRPPSAQDLAANPAVALFIERARAANLSFVADIQTLRSIAALCVRLEGIPLAIELAAARTNILSPAAVLERFEKDPSVLKQQAPDAPARHQSIGDVVEWSYRLLSEREQAVFRRLGVFMGGFDLEAAVAVAGEGEEPGLLDSLASLVDKGLLLFDQGHEREPRYRLLETVRAHAVEHLRAAGEEDMVGGMHARHYLAIAEAEWGRLRYAGYFVFAVSVHVFPPSDRGQRPWPKPLDREYANLRAALSWAQEQDAHLLLRMACALARYWWIRGYLPDAKRWLLEALQQNQNADSVLRGRALGGLGIMYRQSAEYERARTLLDESLSLARSSSSEDLLAAALVNLAGVLESLDLMQEATVLLEEAAELTRSRGDDWVLAVVQTYLGWRDLMLSDGVGAETHLSSALSLFQTQEDERSSFVVTLTLARAIALQSDVGRALSLVDNALPLTRRFGQDTLIAMAAEITAYLVADGPDHVRAAHLFGASDALRERGFRRSTLEAQIYEEGFAVIAAKLDAEALADAVEAGRGLSDEETLDEAQKLIRASLSSRAAPPATKKIAESLLSEREREVVALLATGSSNKEIARGLIISESTAKFHVASVLTKLGVNNRAEAVAVALQRGLL